MTKSVEWVKHHAVIIAIIVTVMLAAMVLLDYSSAAYFLIIILSVFLLVFSLIKIIFDDGKTRAIWWTVVLSAALLLVTSLTYVGNEQTISYLKTQAEADTNIAANSSKQVEHLRSQIELLKNQFELQNRPHVYFSQDIEFHYKDGSVFNPRVDQNPSNSINSKIQDHDQIEYIITKLVAVNYGSQPATYQAQDSEIYLLFNGNQYHPKYQLQEKVLFPNKPETVYTLFMKKENWKTIYEVNYRPTKKMEITWIIDLNYHSMGESDYRSSYRTETTIFEAFERPSIVNPSTIPTSTLST